MFRGSIVALVTPMGAAGEPDPAIYEYTLEQLGGVAPERALFLDDFPWNVSGAAAVGLRTLHVADSPTAAAELLDLLDL